MTRKHYSAEVKAKVALEAIEGMATTFSSSFYYTPTGENPLNLMLMRRGFLCLVAIMGWATRKVLSWRLSNTMEADFCIEALAEALARFRAPEIFNTDQGGQFTSPRFTDILKDGGVRISMDGSGRWMDNVFIERLWRSMTCECVYLHAFDSGSASRAGLGRWTGYYNTRRPRSGLHGQTPDEACHRAALAPSSRRAPEAMPATALAA